MRNWTYVDASNEEFEARRHKETYYRIYHKDTNGTPIVDYKFWANNDDEALAMLTEFNKDHLGEHYYSSSGYYEDCNGKRYDTMKEMHEAWTKEQTDDVQSRSSLIKSIDDNITRCLSERFDTALAEASAEVDKLNAKIAQMKSMKNALIQEVSNIKAEVVSTAKLEKLDDSIDRLKVELFDVEDAIQLLKCKHSISEHQDLYSHIIEDIKFNLTKYLSNDIDSLPTCILSKAAKALNLSESAYYSKIANEDQKHKIYELALKLWKEKLQMLLDAVCGYIFTNNYGIVDDDDVLMQKYAKEHIDDIKYVPGTDKQIDYAKLYDLSKDYWNAIWTWMKEYGENLWI